DPGGPGGARTRSTCADSESLKNHRRNPMSFNKLFLVPFLAFAITACGNDCKSSCEDGNKCAGVTTKVDCDKFCDDLEKLADDADCSDKYDDAASCQADKDDQCK